MPKTIVFASHISEDARIANTLEGIIKTTLLGGVDIFNTSNHSLKPGDPWRDQIIRNLHACAVTLVIATPESVTSSWVNFESGGAWLAEKRVVPCCARGMLKTSLPAPLGHLQALELGRPDDIRHLISILANAAGLDNPTTVDYEKLARQLEESWIDGTNVTPDGTFSKWLNRTVLRPVRHTGERQRGTVPITKREPVYSTDTRQFPREAMIRSGDSLRVTVDLPYLQLRTCYVNGTDADIIAESELPLSFECTIECIGEVKVHDYDYYPGEDEDRTAQFYPAYVLHDLKRM
jgi:hypothetical protein